jgi:hypothetical protein
MTELNVNLQPALLWVTELPQLTCMTLVIAISADSVWRTELGNVDLMHTSSLAFARFFLYLENRNPWVLTICTLDILIIFHSSLLLFVTLFHSSKCSASSNYTHGRPCALNLLKCLLLLSDFNLKWNMLQILVRLSKIKFHENSYSDSRTVTYERLDIQHSEANRCILETFRCRRMW